MMTKNVLDTKDLIYTHSPTKEDANEFGLVQYYRCDFRVWYFDYWYSKEAKRDGWVSCGG
jgi:hypothetical protein